MNVRWILVGCALVTGCVLACGKSEQKTGGGSGSAVDSSAARPSAIGAAFAAKGFVVVQDRKVPAQRSSRKASAVVYRAADGRSGGVVYVARPTNSATERVGWHWYFADAAPDSVSIMEINRDGLWDARIFFPDGAVDMIQGEAFSLLGRERSVTAAMNGASSAPAELWKSFDGDSTTAWRSPRSDAFIEIPVPLGIAQAELDVQLAAGDRPAKLDIYADDRKLQTIELSDGIARQSFSLDPAVRSAGSIRIVVKGRAGDSVAISELEIR